MAKAKVVSYYNSRYLGSLDEETCETLEAIMEIDSSNQKVTGLDHIIFDLTDSDATTIIEENENFGATLSNIEKPIGTLRPEQCNGVGYMFYAGNCILGDSVGFGKTPQVAGLVRMLKLYYKNTLNKPFNYLMLTEKNLIEETRHKMVRFTGEYVVALYGEAKPNKRFADIYHNGCEYGVVGGHTLVNQSIFIDWLMQQKQNGDGFPFQLLIVDESSVFGNHKAKITQNLESLIKYFDRVVFLNATPFESKLGTYYTQLNLLDPKLLPTRTNFSKEYEIFDYRGMYPRATGKYKNASQFRELVAYRYFARTRKDKGAVMEDSSGRLLLSPLSPVQKKLLKLTQMPQIVYDCPNYLDSSIEFNEVNVPKLASLREVLAKDCEDADTVLLFSHYRESQESLSEWLTEMGYSNRILCGDTKDSERNNIIRGFKNAEFRILITNVQKGLDFGDCDYCIFYSFDPNPAKMVQFEGRITRSFDIVNKHVFLLCSEGKEYNRFTSVIRKRAKGMCQFTKQDYSCIMDIMLGDLKDKLD